MNDHEYFLNTSLIISVNGCPEETCSFQIRRSLPETVQEL